MATEQDDDELLIEELEDGSVAVGAAKPEDVPSERSTIAKPADEDDDPPDETAAVSKSEEEREAVRVRRRQERADKKEADRRRDTELAELRAEHQRTSQALAELHKRTQAGDLANIDAALKRKNDEYLYYQGVIAEGVKAQDGTAVANATHQLQNTRAEYERLARLKAEKAQPPQQVVAQQQEVPNPKVIENAKAWHGRNSWYVPGETGDSMIAYALDVTLDREGSFSKDSPEYFAELDKRIAKTLPHRAQKQYAGGAAERQQQTPVSGSGREGGGSQGTRAAGKLYMTPEQVTAAKALGKWADSSSSPEQRKAFRSLAERYDAYNRANPPASH